MKFSTMVAVVMALLFRVDANASSVELAHMRVDNVDQVGISGDLRFDKKLGTLYLDGTYLKLTGESSKYKLELVLKNQVLPNLYTRSAAITHHTHDRVSGGGELYVLRRPALSISGSLSYGREYPSGDFSEFLRGTASDLLLTGGHLVAKKGDAEFSGDYEFVQNYTGNSRHDFEARLKYFFRKHIYLGSSYERARGTDTYRNLVGVEF